MKLKNILIGGSALLTAAILIYKNKKTIPSGVKAVKPFDAEKFMGKWYEIARLNFLFEKHVDYASAEYSMDDQGTIKVINRGYDYKKSQEVEVEGKAVFVNDENEGMLKVSFFGPFYSGYNVIAIDDKYKHALISGSTRKYLWLLSKEKEVPKKIVDEYMKLADDLGYKTSKLVWTSYD